MTRTKTAAQSLLNLHTHPCCDPDIANRQFEHAAVRLAQLVMTDADRTDTALILELLSSVIKRLETAKLNGGPRTISDIMIALSNVYNVKQMVLDGKEK